MTYTCSVCSQTVTEDINAKGHTLEDIPAVSATCTAEGKTKGEKCSVCGTVTKEPETVEAKGHEWIVTSTQDPTYSEPGVKNFTCSACGETKTEELPATGEAIPYNGEPIQFSYIKDDIVISDGIIKHGGYGYSYTPGTEIVITGTTVNSSIIVEKNVSANITLKNVNVSNNDSNGKCAFMIADDSSGNVTVTLSESNQLISTGDFAGLQKNGGSGTLTIQGDGSLTAKGGENGAGIGSGKNRDTSNIVIKSGTIDASCVDAFRNCYGAGIGGGFGGSASNIVISGGSITANSAGNADIGHGKGGSAGTGIVITGGSVNAVNKAIDNPTDGNGNDVYLFNDTAAGTVTITTAAGATYIVKIPGSDRKAYYAYLPAGDVNNPNIIQFTYNGEPYIAGRYYNTENQSWCYAIKSLTVSAPPTKTEYLIGEELDITGGVITAEYDDGIKTEVNMTAAMVSGFSSATEGTKTLTVTYEGKTATFDVTVRAAKVDSITIKTEPEKLEYFIGEKLDVTGGVITAHYEDNTEEDVDMTAAMVSGFSSATVGTKTLTVTYEGKTATFDVTVKAANVTGITIKTKPTKLAYLIGETLDVTGGVITAEYDDGSKTDVNMTAVMVSGFSSATEGTKTLTVTYEGKTATFDITVSASTYTITSDAHVTAPTGAKAGETVSVTVETGYKAAVKDGNGDVIAEITGSGTFTMPESNVAITTSKVHIHEYSPTWSSDSTSHWHECSCGEKDGVAAHTWTETTTTPATCTDAGVLTKTCSVCKKVTTEAIPAKGHTEIAIPDVPATCMDTGLTGGKKCSECNTVTVEPTVIPAKGHTVVIDAAVAPTCTAPGKTAGKHCSVCNTVITEQTDVSAMGHKWDSGTITTQPTETTDGVRTYTCTACGITRTEPIANISHEHTPDTAWASDADSHWHNCSGCSEKLDFGSHTWDGGVVTTQPTETSEGVMTYICLTCGSTKTEAVPKLDHTHTPNSAWDFDDHTHWHNCTGCGEKLDTAAHTWDSGVITVQPTESNEGVKTYTCSACGNTKTEPVGKLDHTHKYDAIWHSDGINHWHECVCGEKSAVSVHTEDGGTVTKPATTEETGIMTYFCSVCRYKLREETIGESARSEEIITEVETSFPNGNSAQADELNTGADTATMLISKIPELNTDTAVKIINAFEKAALHDWQNNNAKINRIKKAIYDIINDEDLTERAFALISKSVYDFDTDKLNFSFGENEWFTESELLGSFVAENPKMSFALANAVIEYLDEKQHTEREIDELNTGWYKKTDFKIEAIIDGETYAYSGRFDIGDGLNTGGGSLIDHIKQINENILTSDRYPYNEQENKNKAKSTLDVLVPFLIKNSVLTAEEKRTLADFKFKNPIEYPAVRDFKEKTDKMFKSINGFSADEIENLAAEYVRGIFEQNGIDAYVVAGAVTGSRSRGLEGENSDIDIVFEIQSDLKEDALFNILNESPYDFDGIKVDINPIRAEETGTLETYLPEAEKYLEEKAQKRTADIQNSAYRQAVILINRYAEDEFGEKADFSDTSRVDLAYSHNEESNMMCQFHKRFIGALHTQTYFPIENSLCSGRG